MEVRDPLNRFTKYTYDASGNVTSVIDPRGKTTQFTYDPVNQVSQITDAINGVTGFTYDPNGNLLTLTDAKNQTTTYTYDNMDRLATRKDALNRTESYQYDLAGNLTQFTDRKNQVANFQYDALNRRTQVTYADATTTFTYDTAGRLIKASDTAPGAGTIDFAYDILNRLVQETTPQGTVAYQYDVLGRRTQMTANGQQPTTYQYDAASRLTRVEQGALFAALGYDHANRRTSLSYSNNTTTSYAYDLASRLTGITHNGPSGVIEALTYQYDAAGNRVSLTRGNGTASLLPNAVASATYDAANEQTAFAGATLVYDANGNLINDGVNTYQWDARNRLMGISGGTTATFNYDALGRRIQKTISTQSSALSTAFLYDGNDIAAEIGGGAVVANYLRALSIDEPFMRQTSTGNEYYHNDVLGSSLALSNAQGSSGTTYTYEPFGKTTVLGASVNPFQFTSREADNTGLHLFRARYYSAPRQRFLGEDPIGFGGGVNVYAYVENNPLGFVDPFGFDKNQKGCAAGGQSSTVSNISITNDPNGPNLNVDLDTTGFPAGSPISVNVNTGSLRSDFNPTGPNTVNFTPYISGTGRVKANGTATVSMPLSGLYPMQYVQIVPQRLREPYAPVITPDVGKPGQVRSSASVRPQTNYDSRCQ